MNFKEKTVDTEMLYKGRVVDLYKDQVELPNGKLAVREVVKHSGGACILAELEDKIFLVRQFRYPYKEEVLELPAGKINVGETPNETAIRELEEEAGLKAESVDLMFEIYPSPGYTNEKIYVYRANGIVNGKMNLDEDEFLSGKWYSKSELKEMIDKKAIKDAKTLIALLSVLK